MGSCSATYDMESESKKRRERKVTQLKTIWGQKTKERKRKRKERGGGVVVCASARLSGA